ncbi:MAG: acyltransferase domain-containing protein [Pseudomonadota bacterium]
MATDQWMTFLHDLIRPPAAPDKPDPVIWMFAGQGAQYFQMGRDLYQGHPVFRDWMEHLDQIVVDQIGHSVLAVLYSDTAKISEPFDQLSDTHPALFMVQVAMAKTLEAEGLGPPDILFGFSLGEYVAAALAGAADMSDVLRDLLEHALIYENLARPGAMLLVLDNVANFNTDPIYADPIELAGVNFETCFVVSGPKHAISTLAQNLQTQEVAHQALPLRYAFHSSAIDHMETAIRPGMKRRRWMRGTIPVVGSVDAAAEPIDFVNRDWWSVVRRPILLGEGLRALHAKYPEATFVDLGPAGNLKTAVQHNIKSLKPSQNHAIVTPFGTGLANLTRLKTALAKEVQS